MGIDGRGFDSVNGIELASFLMYSPDDLGRV